MNGDAINADPDTFHIVRWIAGSLLIYRDKDGEKRYAFGKIVGVRLTCSGIK